MLEADVEVDRRDFTVSAALQVGPGERLALFGPSGAGKTTLLEAIAGLVAPRRARIVLAGRLLTSTDRPVCAVPPWQRRVGLLRQDPGLFPHLRVRDNLRYGRPGRSGPGADAELARLAFLLGIDQLLDAMPARLSGGQAHRVALGRLLFSRCDALLFDEPYTGLDGSLRRVLTGLVIALVAERAVPAILVAHELAEAQAFADRLVVLDRGTVLQVGTPDAAVLRPASRRVAELVGYLSFVPVPGRAGCVAGVHPERVSIGALPDRGLVLAGVVTACHPAGALWETTLRLADAAGTGADGEIGVSVTARLPESHEPGQELVLTAIDPPWFRPDGTAFAAPQAVPAEAAPLTSAAGPAEAAPLTSAAGPAEAAPLTSAGPAAPADRALA